MQQWNRQRRIRLGLGWNNDLTMGIIIAFALFAGVGLSLVTVIVAGVCQSSASRQYGKSYGGGYTACVIITAVIVCALCYLCSPVLESGKGEPSGEVWISLMVVAFLMGASPAIGSAVGCIWVARKRKNDNRFKGSDQR